MFRTSGVDLFHTYSFSIHSHFCINWLTHWFIVNKLKRTLFDQHADVKCGCICGGNTGKCSYLELNCNRLHMHFFSFLFTPKIHYAYLFNAKALQHFKNTSLYTLSVHKFESLYNFDCLGVQHAHHFTFSQNRRQGVSDMNETL